MKEIEHITAVLEKVVFENIPFHLAIRSSLKKEKKGYDGSLLTTITSVCGGYLRHYYSLNKAINELYPSLDEKQKILPGVILSDYLFSKKLDMEEMKKYVEKQNIDADLDKMFETHPDPMSLISSDFVIGSDEYVGLRYNLPVWLVRMWRKNCGHTLSKKLFKSLNKKDKQILRIDGNKISDEEFFKKYLEYKSNDIPGLAIFPENKNPKKLSPVLNEDAINIHAGYSYALESVDLDLFRGIAVYAGGSNDILDEIYVRLGSHLKMDYLCGNQKHFFEVNNKIKRYGLIDLSVYECSYEALRTCISKPVHTFILSPENSCYQKLSEESDYFLSIKQEDLDRLINIQKTALENASELVEDDGYLVYIVPTICKNETSGLVRRFLKEHQNFSLEKEAQLFPFDKYQSMLYFAILKKEIAND